MSKLELKDLISGPPPKRTWLVPGLIPTHGVYVLAGEAGSGKSMLTYHLSLSLASGALFMGVPLKAKRVLYFDEENSRPDLHGYIYKLWRGLVGGDRQIAEDNFRLEHFTIGCSDKSVVHTIRPILEEYDADLMVVDTYTYSFRFRDENSNAEHGHKLREVRTLKSSMRPESTVLLLHHARWNPDTKEWDIRGGKALKGWTDDTLIHSKLKGAPDINGFHKTALEVKKGRAQGHSKFFSVRLKQPEKNTWQVEIKPRKKQGLKVS